MRTRFGPGAAADYYDTLDWCEDHRTGWGDDFIAAFAALSGQLITFPRLYGRVSRAPRGREVRQTLVRGFPFIVTYEVTAAEVIFLSVGHASLRSQPWRRRLP